MVHDTKKSAEQVDQQVADSLTEAARGTAPTMPTQADVDRVTAEAEKVRDDARNWTKG